MHQLTLYVREGCHLCTDMIQELEYLKSEFDFRYFLRDVDAEPGLSATYGDRVPVLVAGEEELCRYFLDKQRMREYLHGH
jgi:thioredoxin reductase (NADPH)